MDKNEFAKGQIMAKLIELEQEWKSITDEPWLLGENGGRSWYYHYRKAAARLSGYESMEPTPENQIKRLYAYAMDKIKKLQREVRHQQEVLEAKNLHLQTMHFVWCSGCSAHHDLTLTKEFVENAVHQTCRLVISWGNASWRNPERGLLTFSIGGENEGAILVGSYLYEQFSGLPWDKASDETKAPWIQLGEKLIRVE